MIIVYKITCWFYENIFANRIDMGVQDTAGNTPLHLTGNFVFNHFCSLKRISNSSVFFFVTVEEDSFDAMDYLLSMYVKCIHSPFWNFIHFCAIICNVLFFCFICLPQAVESAPIYWTKKSSHPSIWPLNWTKCMHWKWWAIIVK